MNQQAITYSCTALAGSNKAGVIHPDAHGYYDLVLGAFNVFNSAKQFYPLEACKHLFEESSALMRRIRDGSLRAEVNHPQREPGQSFRDYLKRILEIRPEKVCAHIGEVRLEEGRVKDRDGNFVVAVMGKVKPAGPFGPSLEESLKNPKENVHFSIRSLTNDVQVGPVLHKKVHTIVTWDHENEGGISIANKYSNPSLETMMEASVPEGMLESVQAMQQQEQKLGLENGQAVSIEEVMKNAGLDKKTDNVDLAKKPRYLKW